MKCRLLVKSINHHSNFIYKRQAARYLANPIADTVVIIITLSGSC
jgi:hypothetical protein